MRRTILTTHVTKRGNSNLNSTQKYAELPWLWGLQVWLGWSVASLLNLDAVTRLASLRTAKKMTPARSQPANRTIDQLPLNKPALEKCPSIDCVLSRQYGKATLQLITYHLQATSYWLPGCRTTHSSCGTTPVWCKRGSRYF